MMNPWAQRKDVTGRVIVGHGNEVSKFRVLPIHKYALIISDAPSSKSERVLNGGNVRPLLQEEPALPDTGRRNIQVVFLADSGCSDTTNTH